MLLIIVIASACLIGIGNALRCKISAKHSRFQLRVGPDTDNHASSKIDTQTFRDFHQLPDWLLRSCDNLGFLHPTEAQSVALPTILDGKDVVLQAQTGSGKTLSYCLPILSKIDAKRGAIQAVIVVPTRELGLQVTSVLKQLTAESPEKVLTMSVIEGSNNRRQILWASAEPPHIVVGNPASLQRLVDQGRLRLNSVNFVVVDEVDACMNKVETKMELHKLLSRHLSNSFLDADDFVDEDVKEFKENKVFRDLSRDSREADAFRGNRQTILCSATIPQRKYFAEACFRNGWTETLPELVNVSQDKLLPENIEHEVIVCDKEQRLQVTAYVLRQEYQRLLSLRSLLEQQRQKEEQTFGFQCIIFVDQESKIDVYADFLLTSLEKHGMLPSSNSLNEKTPSVWVRTLTAEMNIEDRRQSLHSFRRQESAILLCTDLASRGIDIPATALVMQMSLPKTAEDYLHRSGRTGRLNRAGKVITLIQSEEDFVIKRFSNELDVTMKKRVLQAKQR